MDLKKIILNVLEEGHFHIPREVFQDMMNYYLEMYKKFKVNGGKRVTDQQYPPKKFKLDFSKVGKSFEFLKNTPTPPEVTLRFTANNSAQHCRFQAGYNSEIQLSLNDAERVYTEVMEHELLHSLQNILKKHEQFRRNQVDPKDVRVKDKKSIYKSKDPNSIWRAKLPDVEYAGVPKKKFIDQKYDWHGYSKNKYAQRRTTHEKRPIEYYPDLFSSIKSMQRSWYKFAKHHAMDENAVRSEEKKKNFYMLFFNNIKTGKPYPDYAKNFIPSLASKIFEVFKKNGDDFLNMMLKKLYDGFVNKDPDFSYDEFKSVEKQAEDDAYNKQNEKAKKLGLKEPAAFSFDPRSLKLDYYDRGEIFDQVQNEEAEEYLDGNRSENAEYVLNELGLKSKEDKRGNEYVLYPSKITNIIKLFKKIAGLKNSTFDKVSKQASDAMWDGVFNYFLATYTRALTTEALPNLDRRWFRLTGENEKDARRQSKENYDKQIAEYSDNFKKLIGSLRSANV
jgi:hypothetical protein